MNKIFISLLLIALTQLIAAQENKISISQAEQPDTISKHIYGHFAEHLGRGIYDGFFVGKDSEIPNINGMRTDIIEALKELDIPVLRWPGGCFAEQYHWRDGIGALDDRPLVVNRFWGGLSEDNAFGTHEFLELCELLDTEPYIAVNIASGTVKEASEWIEYVTSDVDSHVTRERKKNGRDKPWDVTYWGIGNENWGCGGTMNAEYYTNVFKRYSTYCSGDYKIASGGVFDDLEWTRTFMAEMQEVPNFIDMAHGLSYHYYTICNDWSVKGSATEFDENEWYRSMKNTLLMDENLDEHIAIMDELDPDNKIALIADEWGTWYDVEEGTNPGFLYQQNTLRDALVAALGLNIFNNKARRIKMANIAQTINVLQAMILTEGAQMIKTPSYYVFKLYKAHQDAALLKTDVIVETYNNEQGEIPALSVSASENKEGVIHISIVNVHPNKSINTVIDLDKNIRTAKGEIITADEMNASNNFDTIEEVNISAHDNIEINLNEMKIDIPAKSVILLTVNTND